MAWAARRVPESSDPSVRGQRLDYLGATLAALGLAGVTYALIEGPGTGWDDVVRGFTEPDREWRFQPRTEAVKVYAVPLVSPVTVVLVSGGLPAIVFADWGVDPMYAVTV